MDSKEEVNEKPTSEQFVLKESEVPLNNTCFIPNESRKYRGGNFLIFWRELILFIFMNGFYFIMHSFSCGEKV